MRRAVLLLSVGGATVGCTPERDPALLINETDAPIRVRYAVPLPNVDAGTTPICPLVSQPPEVKPDDRDLRSLGGWMPPTSLEVDAEKCEASYVLEPGVASRLYYDWFCDDYEEYADQGAAFRPSLEYLSIEGHGVVREWRGWDAVALLERNWLSGWCYLRIRES